MPHRHPMAQLLLIASYLILIRFAADVFAGGFPNSAAVRGFKQSVS
jgi:hypothetical protein